MTGYGPWYRSEIATGAVLGGGPVSSGVTWTHAANGSTAQLYPAQLIPGSTGDYSKNKIASATTGTWPFRVYTRAQAVQRIWVLTIVGRSTEHNVSVSVQCGSGSTVSGIPVSSDLGSTVPITYVEDLVVQSAAVSNLTVNITPSGGYARLVSVSCYEQARVQLDASSSDHGVNISRSSRTTDLRAVLPDHDRLHRRHHAGHPPNRRAAPWAVLLVGADEQPRDPLRRLPGHHGAGNAHP